MSSAKSDDLIATIERVLTADTADLRELAKIAGADPRSFYIGTKLDGTDLRGQDLRGMILPNLDHTKVRVDETTLLDQGGPEKEDDHVVEAVDALVLVLAPRLWRTVEQGGHATPRARFFGPEDVEQFAAACLVFDRSKPRLALVDDSRGGWPWKGVDIPEDTITLVHSAHMKPGTQDPPRLNLIDTPQVRVPVLREDRILASAGPAKLPTGLRDAIVYFAADWPVLSRFARRTMTSVFLRARGTSTSPMAWLQLFSWVVQAGMERASGYRLGLPEDRAKVPGLDYEHLFFSHLSRQAIELPHDAKFIAAALVSTELEDSVSDGLGYFQAVWRLLTELGWHVSDLSRTTGSIQTLRVATRARTFDLEVREDCAPALRQTFTLEALKGVELSQVDRFVATEAADTATVLTMLVTARELWISIKDLAFLDAHNRAITPWSIIGEQALRLSRAGQLSQRTQYLTILLLQALSEPCAFEERERLKAVLEDPQFGTRGRLRATTMKRLGDVAELGIAVSHLEGADLRDQMEVMLIFTSDGVVLR